jgi:exosortase A-associated hydrolase 1
LNERALVFDCHGDALLGVLHTPVAAQGIGVVVVVGGPQYRVGSHRQFVHLARALCRAGYAVLRFDVRGMGDSQGSQRPFDRLRDDIAAAIDTLLAHASSVRRVVLWGLCDGASAAWLYLQASGDPRVVGICAANPWVRSSEGLARTHVKHYYAQRVLSRSFWSKLIRGGIGWQAFREASGLPAKTAKTFVNAWRKAALAAVPAVFCCCSATVTTPPRSSLSMSRASPTGKRHFASAVPCAATSSARITRCRRTRPVSMSRTPRCDGWTR